MKTCYDEFLDSRGVFSSVTEKGGGHMFGEVTSVQKKKQHIFTTVKKETSIRGTNRSGSAG